MMNLWIVILKHNSINYTILIKRDFLRIWYSLIVGKAPFTASHSISVDILIIILRALSLANRSKSVTHLEDYSTRIFLR